MTLGLFTILISVPIQISQRQRGFFSSAPEDKNMVTYACHKCCRFSQEQQLRATSLTIISISGDFFTKYCIQRAQHNSSNLCTKLQRFLEGFSFSLYFHIYLELCYFAVLLLKFLCNAHSWKYHLSRHDDYSLKVIMITLYFFGWLVFICLFVGIFVC